MRRLIPLVLLSGLIAGARAEEAPPEPTAEGALDAVWEALSTQLHDAERARTHLTPEVRAALAAEAAAAPDLYAFAPVLDAFVRGLGVSHTAFLTDRTVDFAFFRSLFGTRDVDTPRVHHMGAQFATVDGERVVRAVIDGYPAARAGLRRGDAVLAADGVPFDPWAAFNPGGRAARLTVRRAGETFETVVRPVHENPHRSFVAATERSVRTIEREGRRLGYLHLWVGTHADTIATVVRAATETFADHDGLVLDLRGGYGGAWHAHLDPFFPDRSGFWTTTVIDRDGGVETVPPEPVAPHPWYDGPLVVLIDAGVRSGKEALAWQFRKRPETVLVGTRTSGSFTAGQGTFNDPATPFFLYLAVAEFRLDGEAIEGVGVAPDVAVPYPLDDAPAADPQLDVALDELTRLVAEHGPGAARRPGESAVRRPGESALRRPGEDA